MVFRIVMIKPITVKMIDIIREIIIEMIKIKKSYLKDSLSYSAYA